MNINTVPSTDQRVDPGSLPFGQAGAKALADERERLERASVAGKVALWEWDIPTGTMQWSSVVDDLLGYGPGEFPRTIEAWEAAIHPRDREQETACLRAHLQYGQPYVVDYRIRRKDGTYAWWHDEGKVRRDAQGNVLRMAGASVDVTERRRAEDALRGSEARLNQAERLAHLGSWEMELISLEDLSQNPLSWSTETFRIFGCELDKANVTRQLFASRVHPEDRAKVSAAIQAALHERRPYSVEHRVLRQDGSERIVQEKAEIICDPATQRPLKLIGTVQDITEPRSIQLQIEGISRMREYLLGSSDFQSKLKYITDTVVTVFKADFARIWIVRKGDRCASGCLHARATSGPAVCQTRERCLHLESSSGRYTHINSEVHGRVPLDCYDIGRLAASANLKLIINDVAHDPEVTDHVWAKALGLTAFAGYRLIAGQGETIGVFALFSQQAISPNESVLLEEIAASASHVIQASQTEAARVDLETQLRQAHKMESVGRLAGGVAHDFNNMLQAILGNVDLALGEVPPSGTLRESLEEIRKSALRSAELTRQLLAFARKQTIHPTVLDLNETVSGMLKMLKRLIGENIQLLWTPGPALWPIMMDASQIDQILANLTVNARDAITGAGKLTIETANITIDAAYTDSHPDCAPGDYVTLSVSDTGQGMDAETRAHLFEPFFTTKEPGKGTGLGLATVFGIVKQNHGFINVSSESGRGSVFKLYLPRTGVTAAEKAPPAPRSVRGTETVLLVEDEVQILTLGRRILEVHGYTVLAARNPKAALALALSHPGRIHLLITDVVMPGMNGKELKQRLLTSHPGLKCLFMSGYTANVMAEHGILDESVELLQKPFTNQAFAERVRDLLG